MSKPVLAAGAVCWRLVDGKVRILVIHRTQYGDVTLPKGKVEPGEPLAATAVREVREETGLALALGAPLGTSRYTLDNGREKYVRYWAAEAGAQAIRDSTFVPGREVAAIEWVGIKKARKYLSYGRDVEIVDAFAARVEAGVLGTFALVVLRHGKAVPASEWDGPDASRPLTKRGVAQAASNAPTIAAWRPRKLVTSTAVRCVTTVAPLAAAYGLAPKREHGISQEALEAGEERIREVVGKRVRKQKTAVLCSHGPVIPRLLREIALATGTEPDGERQGEIEAASGLETGCFAVVHLSVEHPGSGIVAIETHAPLA